MQSGVDNFRVRTDFRTQIHQCWKAPVAAKTYRGKIPLLQLALNRDGSLSSEPVLLNSSDEPLFYEIAQSAKRAVSRCVPLKVSPEGAEHYERWKLLIIRFAPANLKPGSYPKSLRCLEVSARIADTPGSACGSRYVRGAYTASHSAVVRIGLDTSLKRTSPSAGNVRGLRAIPVLPPDSSVPMPGGLTGTKPRLAVSGAAGAPTCLRDSGASVELERARPC